MYDRSCQICPICKMCKIICQIICQTYQLTHPSACGACSLQALLVFCIKRFWSLVSCYDVTPCISFVSDPQCDSSLIIPLFCNHVSLIVQSMTMLKHSLIIEPSCITFNHTSLAFQRMAMFKHSAIRLWVIWLFALSSGWLVHGCMKHLNSLNFFVKLFHLVVGPPWWSPVCSICGCLSLCLWHSCLSPCATFFCWCLTLCLCHSCLSPCLSLCTTCMQLVSGAFLSLPLPLPCFACSRE